MATKTERHYQNNGINWSFSLSYRPPAEAPGVLTEWQEELDFPGVRVDFAGSNSFVRAHVQSFSEIYEGQGYWSHFDGVNGAKSSYGRGREFRAATLHAAEEQAEAFIAELQAAMLALVNARSTRLAKREATIVRAHANHGAITATDDDPAPAPGEPGFIGPLEAPRYDTAYPV
jgi:hypothetical protein